MWLLLLSALVAVSASAGNNCRGTANTLPLETQTPKFVRAVKNGALYTVDSVSPSLLVAHIWGAPGRERCGRLLLDFSFCLTSCSQVVLHTARC